MQFQANVLVAMHASHAISGTRAMYVMQLADANYVFSVIYIYVAHVLLSTLSMRAHMRAHALARVCKVGTDARRQVVVYIMYMYI